ncbi:uncharacterized protein EDB93DRAFT_1297951 [Suillus bovinus]|uniref:uncharacterized protein n=1 Tax=Suillus bovinus TaxID=48563 RepID=UPI001B878A2B|nr:uncharacterized protein EDB93DRAFT_1297951 [Suillus bovinus]KAG2139816.1 hypothetical protein EDB93DRAFT_1297951 [Suillus bovinus]
MLHTTTKEWNPWERWRDLYVPEALEQCGISYNRILKTGDPGLKDSFRQDTCTALRMVVAAGIDHFAYPNDDDKEYTWIWNGKFGPLTADWLLDCPKEIHNMRVIDIDAVGNALLLFSYTQIEPSRLVQDRIAPFLNDDQSLKFRHIALRAAWQQIHCADMYEPFHATASFLHAVLKAIFPMVPNEQDRITNAIELLNFPEWPGGSDLATFPLLKIQFLVLLVLPAPKVDNLASYTPYCRALIRCMGRDRPHYLRRSASNIVCDTRRDLVKLATATRANKSLQDELCGGLITAPFTYLNDLLTNEENPPLMPIVRLVFILAKSSDWHPYLTRDGSIEEWTCRHTHAL